MFQLQKKKQILQFLKRCCEMIKMLSKKNSVKVTRYTLKSKIWKIKKKSFKNVENISSCHV